MNLDDDDILFEIGKKKASGQPEKVLNPDKSPKRKSNSNPYFNSALKTKVDQLWKENWQILALLGGLIFVVYINSVANGFVSDDKGLVDPRNYSSFAKIFEDPFAALRLIFYALVHPLCGDVSACYRLPSLLAHFLNAALIYLLVRFLMSKQVAFFASVLFAVHPLLAEGVGWISAGAYPIYTFFFLASFSLYILSERIDSKYLTANLSRRVLYFSSIGLMVIALFTTNRVMALPIFFLYELILGDFRKNWKRLMPFMVLGLIWAGVHVFQIRGRVEQVEGQGGGGPSIYSPLFLLPFSIGNYFKLFVWPMALSFYHTDYEQPVREMALRWGILLAFVSFLIVAFFKSKKLFFWGGFFILGLLLYILPIQLAWLVAERYVYLASIGLFVITAVIFDKISQKKGLRLPVLIFFWLIAILLGVRTIMRNFDWQNEDTLLTATLKTNPENAKAHNHVGIIYGKNKDYTSAIKEFETAIKLDPQLAEAYHNLGNAHDEQGRALLQTDPAKAEEFYKIAVPLYEKALSIDPKHWQSYQQLANIAFDRKEYQKTIDYLMKLLPLNPNPAFIANIGYVYTQMGEIDKAKEAYQEVLRMDPTNQAAQQALQQLANPSPVSSSPQTKTEENPALPGGQLPPEVLKALQEQTQKQATSSAPQ